MSAACPLCRKVLPSPASLGGHFSQAHARTRSTGYARLLVARPAWFDSAACHGQDPALWHPDGRVPDATTRALRVCQSCPVRVECLDHAISTGETIGIWGGTHAAQRQRIADRRAGRPA